MTTEADQVRAAKLAEEVTELRKRLADPATPKSGRRRIKLQIETSTWLMAKLDPARYGKNLKPSKLGKSIRLGDLLEGIKDKLY